MESESEMADEVKRKNILHWNYRELDEIPIVVKTHGANVREIYLKWNKLKFLPNWIFELENLQNLYLAGNFIQKLPKEIQYSRLTVLDLNSNKLEFIPTSVASLITLKCLLLDDNFITNIPSDFSQLKNLEYLSICRNQLEILPEWLGSLEKLEDLFVDNNNLEVLPNRLTLAPKLSNISICSNRLRYLPLNGFLSSPFIRFDANRDLNYLSYSLLCQLVSKIRDSLGGDLRNVISRGCFQKTTIESKSRNQKLKISPDDYEGSEEITIEFPPQLLKIHKISDNVVCTLYELALRKVYKNRFHHTLERRLSPLELNIIYEPQCLGNDFQSFCHFFPATLMENGPVSICLNDYCQEPIFTESWIIFRLYSQFYDVPTCALFCSCRCASRFANCFSESRNRYFFN
ncbi:leucine-rich repeat and calponin homology domain-containing protein 2 [Leptopilina heterotoma]|uniref:leucine-rich repeat and calponin homology domain-containing protein 2 n=1 Tax=Leptopilina heterotoma TaxID=63436 RepID=UPI001CA826EA|nr:leucine-rich repeat and calponin homology domain-containing protein 2 [Leptopilina heterotoma]